MKEFPIPMVNVGPGSQPADEDGASLDYMTLPVAMDTYHMPAIEAPDDVVTREVATGVLRDIMHALNQYREKGTATVLDISDLNDSSRTLVNQVLGEGEVSAIVGGPRAAQIQESVLAGVWRLQYLDEAGTVTRDTIEIADIPEAVRPRGDTQTQFAGHIDKEGIPEGVINALPVLAELADRSTGFRAGDEAHVVNLTLLPQTEADVTFLVETLGAGTVVILSRGYGNCRIASTGSNAIWWVQYFNSQETLILNTLEVTDMPRVACAALEDIEDSIERLAEIIEVYL